MVEYGSSDIKAFKPLLARKDVGFEDEDLSDIEEFYLHEIENIHNDDLLKKLQKAEYNLKKQIPALESKLRALLMRNGDSKQIRDIEERLKTMRENQLLITKQLSSFAFNSKQPSSMTPKNINPDSLSQKSSKKLNDDQLQAKRLILSSPRAGSDSSLSVSIDASASVSKKSTKNIRVNKDAENKFSVIGKSDQQIQRFYN